MHLIEQELSADTRKSFTYINETSENQATPASFALDHCQQGQEGLRATTLRDKSALLMREAIRDEGQDPPTNA